jgi:hypothetical protein
LHNGIRNFNFDSKREEVFNNSSVGMAFVQGVNRCGCTGDEKLVKSIAETAARLLHREQTFEMLLLCEVFANLEVKLGWK